MAPSIDDIVKQAYEMIDAQPDYTIPKLEAWRKKHHIEGNGISACQSCGGPIIHAKDKHPERCKACRKKISDLFKVRKSKAFFKKSVIITQ